MQQHNREADITYAISRTLQDEGHSLVAIAVKLFGYADPSAQGEQYLMHPQTGAGFYVATDETGLQVGIMPFALGSRSQQSAARFVMEHAGLRSHLEVLPYVRAGMNNKTWTPG